MTKDGTPSIPSSSDTPSKGAGVSGSIQERVAQEFTGSKLVFARGIAEGLVVRLDAAADPLTLQATLREFMISRSGFLKGSSVYLDWFGGEPAAPLVKEVTSILKKEFMVDAEALPARLRSKVEVLASSEVGSSKGTPGGRRSSTMNREEDAGLSLFDGFDSDDFSDDPLDDDLEDVASEGSDGIESSREMRLKGQASGRSKSGVKNVGYDLADDLSEEILGDVADARMVFGTLRSGQRVESEHSLVIAGDINSGAEVVAGGDIFVLGKLRGVAHAGAYDETGGGRVIFALELEPTQLRIGSVITRGGADSSAKARPEMARVDGNMILVEPYQNRRIGIARKAV